MRKCWLPGFWPKAERTITKLKALVEKPYRARKTAFSVAWGN